MTTATADTSYRVTAPLVIVRGARGSQGLFYRDTVIGRWDTGDQGHDEPKPDEIGRLLDLGMIEAI
jgi:hypothetical protein